VVVVIVVHACCLIAAQTEEARAEAITLMGSVANLSTPKNGEVLIAATQVRSSTGTLHDASYCRPLLEGGVFPFDLLKPLLPETRKPVSRRTFKMLT
jgi:hypothetical protein